MEPRRGTLVPVAELRQAAVDSPDEAFLTINGRTFSFAEASDVTDAVAAGLVHLGLAAGDRVIVMGPNRPEIVWAWLGVNALSAVDVPINTDAVGVSLAYYSRDCEPVGIVATAEYVDRLATELPSTVRFVVTIGGHAPSGTLPEHVLVTTFEALVTSGSPDDRAASRTPPADFEPASILYSSGTTGPSKGAVLPHGYWATAARRLIACVELTKRNRVYCAQPLFHIDARLAIAAALYVRGQVCIATRFSASRIWQEIEELQADIFCFVGVMIHILCKQPRSARDATTPLKIAYGSATPAAVHREFEERFGVDIVEIYGMTEFAMIATQQLGRGEPGHVGVPTPEVEVRIVDENDVEVAPGRLGELTIRPRVPNALMHGYFNKPVETLAAFRNLWFHTGDLFRWREDGALEFAGRKKDSIRRRGENISAWEVEEAALRHPGVLEAGAIGVPSELGEEEVALIVVETEQGQLDAEDLRNFMRRDLPSFAVPRFIESVTSLPKTASGKVQKGELRARGVSTSACDFQSGERASP